MRYAVVRNISHETLFRKEVRMKLTIYALLILAVAGFAAERVVLWEYYTQTG